MSSDRLTQVWQPGPCSTSYRCSSLQRRAQQFCSSPLWARSTTLLRHRRQVASAGNDPSEVVQEALVALRKADTDGLSAHLLPGLLQLGHAERQVLLVGGQPFVEDGPLANFSEVVDTGARRLLPGNLLRRCRVLSSLRTGEHRFMQRVAVTACTGEEGTLDWTLQQRDGRWWVCSIRRDPSTDSPLPMQPHPRNSPEAVTLAQLELLQHGDVSGAARFHVYATIPRGEDMSQRAMATMLQSDRFLPILGHVEVELGASALPSGRKFVQEVSVSAPRGRFAGQRLPDETVGADPSRPGERLLRQSFVWTLGLRDCGQWLVQTVEAVVLDA